MIINNIKKFYEIIIPKFLQNFVRDLMIVKNNKNFFLVKKNGYSEDGLATNHVVDFLQDKKFLTSYDNATKNNELGIHPGKIRFRAYIVNYFANYALKLARKNKKSNFVELGTGKGVMAKVIISNTKLNKKKNINFYLFDTYKGIPISKISTNEIKNTTFMNKNIFKGNYYEFVKKKFKKNKNVKLIKGILPETIKKNDYLLKNIVFLHIDLNNANSEIQSIRLLYDRLSYGAVVILDDYCYSEVFRNLKNKWDKFIKTKNNSILSLPTGQGVFFKI